MEDMVDNFFFISARCIQNSEFAKKAWVFSGKDYTCPVLLLSLPLRSYLSYLI
jgi:hypothetical protein